jgi:hypothetical protein
MPAAWQLKEMRKVLVGVLHVDVVPIAWALNLRRMVIPGEVAAVSGMPYDMARNALCARALTEGWEYLFFLDSDVTPPVDAIPRLMAHKKPLVSGVYHRRSEPAGVPVMIKGGQWVFDPPPNRVIEVDVVGAGCLLIHRSVLEQLPPQDERRGKRWFDWRVDMPGLPPGEAMSEDFTFNLHVKRTLGVPTLVDTSVVCGHIGLAEFNHNSARPARAA